MSHQPLHLPPGKNTQTSGMMLQHHKSLTKQQDNTTSNTQLNQGGNLSYKNPTQRNNSHIDDGNPFLQLSLIQSNSSGKNNDMQ